MPWERIYRQLRPIFVGDITGDCLELGVRITILYSTMNDTSLSSKPSPNTHNLDCRLGRDVTLNITTKMQD